MTSALAIRLDMQGVSKSYDGTHALRAVDFSARGGEVHAIAGENGAGKSTLVKILTGAIQADSGRIMIDGSATLIDSPRRAQRLGIRSVHQHLSLVPNLSVAENVLLGIWPSRPIRQLIDWQRTHRQAQELLASVGLVDIDIRKPVATLSVAHQQMVEIAKALAEQPRILILDEPSAVLTQGELELLFAVIERLRNEGVLVVYISHRLDEVFRISDRVTVLKDGKLVDTVQTAELTRRSLVRMMIGRTLDEIFTDRLQEPGQTVLQVCGLSRTGSFHGISFTIGAREIVGLYGLVGSGRTEMARCIFGADRPSSGTVKIGQQIFRPTSPRSALDAGVAMLTEDRSRDGLILFMPTLDNMSLAAMQKMSNLGIVNRRRQLQEVRAMVDLLQIRPPHLRIPVRALSGGNQQKVVLAKWLLVHTPVLILDEPTCGVDVATKHEIYKLVRTLADQGTAILLISSEMPEVLGMSDRILIMREGQIVDECTRLEASEERLLSSAAGITRGIQIQ